MFASFQAGNRKIYTDKLIEKKILALHKRRFKVSTAQRSPETGKVWARLNATTARRRKFKKRGKLKLLDSGSMRDALFIKRAKMVDALTGPRGIGISTVTLRDRDSKSSGNSLLDVGRAHQFGTFAMPARPFLGVGKKDGKDIEKIFNLRLSRSTPGFGNPMS